MKWRVFVYIGVIHRIKKALCFLFKPPEIYGHTKVIKVKALHNNLYLPVVAVNVFTIARVISEAVGG